MNSRYNAEFYNSRDNSIHKKLTTVTCKLSYVTDTVSILCSSDVRSKEQSTVGNCLGHRVMPHIYRSETKIDKLQYEGWRHGKTTYKQYLRSHKGGFATSGMVEDRTYIVVRFSARRHMKVALQSQFKFSSVIIRCLLHTIHTSRLIGDSRPGTHMNNFSLSHSPGALLLKPIQGSNFDAQGLVDVPNVEEESRLSLG